MWKNVHCSDETLGELFMCICIGMCGVQHLEHFFLTAKYDGRKNITGCYSSPETEEMAQTTVVGSRIESKYRSVLAENVLVSKRLETEGT